MPLKWNLSYTHNLNSNTTLGIDFLSEIRNILELEIGMALSRSGSKEGYTILINYLDDARAVLAEYAHLSLQLLQQNNFGKDKKQWNQWLNSLQSTFSPSPLKKRIDG